MTKIYTDHAQRAKEVRVELEKASHLVLAWLEEAGKVRRIAPGVWATVKPESADAPEG